MVDIISYKVGFLHDATVFGCSRTASAEGGRYIDVEQKQLEGVYGHYRNRAILGSFRCCRVVNIHGLQYLWYLHVNRV